MILSIDPGLNHIGVALWTPKGMLKRAWLAKSTGTVLEPGERWRRAAQAVLPIPRVATLILERPQIYRMSKGDPNDLIDIAAVCGVFVELFPWADVYTYLPREWKGNTPKHITETRARKALTAIEVRRVELPSKTLTHNVWDAVGLGLFHLRGERK